VSSTGCTCGTQGYYCRRGTILLLLYSDPLDISLLQERNYSPHTLQCSARYILQERNYSPPTLQLYPLDTVGTGILLQERNYSPSILQ
jgi:hypothetical protein